MRPELVKIGSFSLPSYGAMMAIAFFVGIAIASRRAPKFGLTKEQVIDISFWAILCGILGARILYIAQEWSYFSAHRSELFSLKFQGLTSFGGFFGGALGALIATRKNRGAFLGFLDAAAPSALLGLAIGRVGCLLNGCCYGPECAPGALFAVSNLQTKSTHFPTQLLDSALCIAGTGLLLWAERGFTKRLQTLGYAAIVMGVSRIVYEVTRAGRSSTTIGATGITEAQIVAGGLILVGLALLVFARRPLSEPISKTQVSG